MPLFASITLTEKVVLPVVVGVPDRTPAEDRVSPGGRVPAFTDQVYGVVPPVAAKVKLYAVLTTAVGGAPDVMDTPAATVMLVAWVALWPLASVTLAVKEYVPVAVGAEADAGRQDAAAHRPGVRAGPARFGQGVAVDGVGPSPGGGAKAID